MRMILIGGPLRRNPQDSRINVLADLHSLDPNALGLGELGKRDNLLTARVSRLRLARFPRHHLARKRHSTVEQSASLHCSEATRRNSHHLRARRSSLIGLVLPLMITPRERQTRQNLLATAAISFSTNKSMDNAFFCVYWQSDCFYADIDSSVGSFLAVLRRDWRESHTPNSEAFGGTPFNCSVRFAASAGEKG
jgi:hypothetical protein